MKIRAIDYDHDETPEALTFVMTLAEAAAIHAVFGKFNRYAQRKLGLTDNDDVYGGITVVFNGHWEDGRPPGAPCIDHVSDLAGLNSPLHQEEAT